MFFLFFVKTIFVLEKKNIFYTNPSTNIYICKKREGDKNGECKPVNATVRAVGINKALALPEILLRFNVIIFLYTSI